MGYWWIFRTAVLLSFKWVELKSMTSSIENPEFLATLLLIFLESALSDIYIAQHFPLLYSKIVQRTLVKGNVFEIRYDMLIWPLLPCLGTEIAIHWQVKTFPFRSWRPKLVWAPKPSVFLHLPFLPWGHCYWFYNKQGLASSNPAVHMLSDCCDITNYISTGFSKMHFYL